jgi:hypothetical protein
MTLPLSRDYDAVDAGPLTHTTVNNLQDAIVEKHHGLIYHWQPASMGLTFWGTGNDPASIGFADPEDLVNNFGVLANDSASQDLYIRYSPIIPLGSKITEVALWIHEITTAGSNFLLQTQTMSTVAVPAVATATGWSLSTVGSTSTYPTLVSMTGTALELTDTVIPTLRVIMKKESIIYGVRWRYYKD